MDKNSTGKKPVSVRSILRIIGAALFALIGISAMICVIFICINFRDSKPILTFSPDIPRRRVVELMDSICNGDFDTAEKCFLGNPNLGVDTAPTDEVSTLIWDAFLDSTTYTLSGDCYTTDDGLAQNITFTCLDISSVTVNLRERSQTLLKQRVDDASDVSEIYDENNEYRTDVVNEVLHQAVEDALKEDARTLTTEVTLNLQYHDEQWWIEADQALLDVLFGDVLFYAS